MTVALAIFCALQPTVRAQQPAAVPAFTSDFEGITQLPADWTVEGNVSIDTNEAFKGAHSLVLSRTQLEAEKPCSVVTPAFKTKPGLWDISGGIKPDLYSPDSSFDGMVTLECLDASGKVVGQIIVSDVFGKNGWNTFGGQFEIPKAAVASTRPTGTSGLTNFRSPISGKRRTSISTGSSFPPWRWGTCFTRPIRGWSA